MENQKPKKKCGMCGNYDAYYIRGYCNFIKRDCGFCVNRQAIVNKQDICENFKIRTYKRRARSKVLANILSDMSVTLEQIRQILAAEHDDEAD